MGRKARMRRLLREEDLEELLEQAEPEAKQAVAAKAENEDAPAAKVLELQKTAGNRAVGAALDRWALPWIPQAAQQQATWPKEPQLIIDGKMVIPLEAYSEGNQNTSVGSVGSSEREPEKDRFTGPGEMHVVFNLNELAAELARATAEGKHYDSVQIVVPFKDGNGIRWILTDVMISGYQVGSASSGKDPVVALSLSFKKRELARTPPPKR
jgi:type VI protein secretion system component Hcp